jgi:hypothetical protein
MRAKFQDQPIFLGQGYSTDAQQGAMVSCFLNGTITPGGTPSNDIGFSSAVSFEDIQKALNINVQESVGIGMFSESASATYAQQIEETQYSLSFHYFEKIYMPSQSWTPLNISVGALTYYGQQVYQLEPENFRLVCGDQIVTSVNTGVSFYATMSVTFSSYSQKQTFQANAGTSFGDIVSVSAAVQTMVSQYDLSGEVSVYGFQQGGNPSLLPQIFAKNAGGYYVTSCSLQDLQACQDTINGVLDYATSNLPNQTIPGSGVQLDFTLNDVSTILLLNTGNTTITPQVETARQWLGDSYQNQTAQLTFVSHLLGSWYMGEQFVAAPILAELSSTQSNLQSNIALFEDNGNGAIGCYQNPPQCLSIANNINSSMAYINDSFIDIFNNGVQYTYISPGCSVPQYRTQIVGMYPIDQNYYKGSLLNGNSWNDPNLWLWNIYNLNQTNLELRIAGPNNPNLPFQDCASPSNSPDNPYIYDVSYPPAPYDECLNCCGCTSAEISFEFIDNPL